MDEKRSPNEKWDRQTKLRELLGYINLSEGQPDPHFQKGLSDFFQHASTPEPWRELNLELQHTIAELTGHSAAFQNSRQAEAVVALVFNHLIPEYRSHHQDLLFHLSDQELLQPFLIARMFEAILAEGGPWDDTDRIVRNTLLRLNDFIGYRPLAVLEGKACEPYDRERVRPIPLYIRGAGVAAGKYQPIISRVIQILEQTQPGMLREAQFDPTKLDELALDPRAYDFGHPVNQRPNYQFGEWDPHCIDNNGYYRRFVLRTVTVDALLHRVLELRGSVVVGLGEGKEASRVGAGLPRDSSGGTPASGAIKEDELLFEAAAVLAGTMLMASATSGSGPGAYESSVTLGTLVPRIAQLRDQFYDLWIQQLSGPHGKRLREEAARLHQPFGGARQFLNQYLARLRAAQLQHSHLARLYTEMGYPDAGREESHRVVTASERITTEIFCQITASSMRLDEGDLAAALNEVEVVEELLHRGIRCGALIDPWNILGFQGQFSLFPALENSIPDPRADDLIGLVESTFLWYARLLMEAAAAGNETVRERVHHRFQRLAAWWDQFATVEIIGIPHVHGQKAFEAASHVAQAMSDWRQAGEGAGNIRFWREHSTGFNSPRAFAQVVDALLMKHDYVAAMALLVSWLSQASSVPLHEEPHSFHELAIRWLTGVLSDERAGTFNQSSAWPLIMKFFDYLEANADDYWHVPGFDFGRNIDMLHGSAEPLDWDDEEGDEPDQVYSAAYDGVTYRDSAEDGHEGELVEGGLDRNESEWEAAIERIEPRLQFLATLARLFRIAADHSLEAHLELLAAALDVPVPSVPDGAHPEQAAAANDRADVVRSWLKHLQANQHGLARLGLEIERTAVAPPLGSHDSLVEYDRERTIREHLIYAVIATQTETASAIRRLLCALAAVPDDVPLSDWERQAVRLERALPREQPASIRPLLPPFLEAISREPLLYRRLDKGGEARRIVAARSVQQFFQVLVESLPRAGLIRDTYGVLRTARQMELDHSVGDGISEFDHLARTALRAIVDSVVEASADWTPYEQADTPLLECLEMVTQPFLKIWLDHSQSVRLTALDRMGDESDWDELRKFIETYGRDLLTPRFLMLGNLRAILDNGVGRYLDYLAENADPLHPVKLLEDLGGRIGRSTAERLLELVMQIFVENYEEYKDYNTTTTQSDYGERFYILFDFLRVKSLYIRTSWNLQPIEIVHEVLAGRGKMSAAEQWQHAFSEKTGPLADRLADSLADLEKKYGVRLATVRDLVADRFTRPLTLDRIRMLIPLAIEESQGIGDGAPGQEGQKGQEQQTRPEEERTGSTTTFELFRRAIGEFAETTSGVGLDVPSWLRELEEEVDDLGRHQESIIELMDELRFPRRAQFTRKHLDEELDAWESAN